MRSLLGIAALAAVVVTTSIQVTGLPLSSDIQVESLVQRRGIPDIAMQRRDESIFYNKRAAGAEVRPAGASGAAKPPAAGKGAAEPAAQQHVPTPVKAQEAPKTGGPMPSPPANAPANPQTGADATKGKQNCKRMMEGNACNADNLSYLGALSDDESSSSKSRSIKSSSTAGSPAGKKDDGKTGGPKGDDAHSGKDQFFDAKENPHDPDPEPPKDNGKGKGKAAQEQKPGADKADTSHLSPPLDLHRAGSASSNGGPGNSQHPVDGSLGSKASAGHNGPTTPPGSPTSHTPEGSPPGSPAPSVGEKPEDKDDKDKDDKDKKDEEETGWKKHKYPAMIAGAAAATGLIGGWTSSYYSANLFSNASKGTKKNTIDGPVEICTTPGCGSQGQAQDGQNQDGSGGQPAGSTDQPADGTDQPADGTDKPADGGSDQPAEGQPPQDTNNGENNTGENNNGDNNNGNGNNGDNNNGNDNNGDGNNGNNNDGNNNVGDNHQGDNQTGEAEPPKLRRRVARAFQA